MCQPCDLVEKVLGITVHLQRYGNTEFILNETVSQSISLTIPMLKHLHSLKIKKLESIGIQTLKNQTLFRIVETNEETAK